MAEQKQANPVGSMTGIYFAFFMVIMMILLFPGFRNALAVGVGYVFTPLLGFGGKFPVLTIIFAGLLLTIINMYARHYFVNWYEAARIQHKTKYISRKVRDAYRTRDIGKVQKYQKVQQKLMVDQMKISQEQMKPMIVTLIIVIAIFSWLYYYLDSIPGYLRVFAMPWTWPSGIDITGGISMFPYWLILYSFFTFPLGYFITYLFKLYEFRKRLREI
ncbi:MAG: DUF106 domain-containing protein [Thermoplasmata archaeon]|mgnify:FL=1